MGRALLLALLAVGSIAIALGLVGAPGVEPPPAPRGSTSEIVESGSLATDSTARTTTHADPDDNPIVDRKSLTSGEGSRTLQVRCRCAIIEVDRLDAVWSFLGLEVQVEGPDGRPLGASEKPQETFAVSVPNNAREITLRAPGYRERTVRLPTHPAGEQEPLVVTLEPDASVTVEVRGLPVNPDPKLSVTPSFQENWMGEVPLLWPSAKHSMAPRGGRAELTIPVPSGLLTTLRIEPEESPQPAGIRVKRSERFELDPGEDHRVVFDLTREPAVTGRLTGLPAVALRGQSIRLREAEHGGETESRTDDRGRFAFAGLPATDFALVVGAWQIPLHEPDSGLATWDPTRGHELAVEPAEPTTGLLFVRNGEPVDAPSAISFHGPPRTETATTTVPLFTTETLVSELLLHAWVEGVGHFTRPTAELRQDDDGLVRVEVPTGMGSVLVRADEPTSYLRVRARLAATDLDLGRPWSGIWAERVENGWLLDSLEPGAYVLQWTAEVRSQRAFRHPVEVLAGRRTELEVLVPRPKILRGEVANWQDIPADLRPRLVFVGSPVLHRAGQITPEGTFEIRVLGAPDAVDTASFSGDGFCPEVLTRDLVYDPEGPSLRVTFPLAQTGGWLHVKPIDGGELRAMSPSKSAQRLMPNRSWMAGRIAKLSPEGRMRLLDTGGPIDVMVMEIVGRSSHHLGWFQIANARQDHQLTPRGRWVEIDATAIREEYGPIVLCELTGPAWWRHGGIPFGIVIDDGGVGRLWLPADATAVSFHGDAIPTEQVRNRIELDARGRIVR